MPVEHVIFAEQDSAWTTWVTPDKAVAVDSWSLDPGVARVERRVTGQSRGLKHTWLGSKLPTGSFEMPAFWERLGYFIKAAGLNDIASTQQGATDAYEHGFLPNDASVPYGLSVQLKRDTDDADNIMGVVITSMTFNCQAGEPLVLSGNYLAYDEAPTDGTWESGDSAPAVIASPSYVADSILPYRFQHATLTVGGTVSFNDTTNVFTVSGGTEYTVEMAEVAVDQAWDARVFLGSRLAGNVIGQDRSVTGRFDLDQSSVNEAMRTLYRAGTTAALKLTFDSGVEADTGYNYQLEIVLPSIDITSAALPDISGSNDRRMQSVEFTALVGADDHDIGIRLVDTATSY